MGKRVTLDLQEHIVARAYEVATRSARDIEEVLAEWIGQYVNDLPVEDLSNAEVLQLCRYELNPIHEHELRQLLCQRREYSLSGTESGRLDELLQIYRKGVVRKARALQVASARGLLPDLL